MSDFIIRHIEAISSVVGMLVLILMMNGFEYVKDTKFEILHKYYFLILIIIGVLVSSSAVGKWIVK